MVILLRIILGLGGAVLIFMASGFLVDPASAGAGFGLTADGAHGLTSMRADFTAFFGVAGACLIWGAWQRSRDPLIIGGALMLMPLVARFVSLALHGSFEGFITPMVFEGVFGIVAIIGSRVLPVSR